MMYYVFRINGNAHVNHFLCFSAQARPSAAGWLATQPARSKTPHTPHHTQPESLAPSASRAVQKAGEKRNGSRHY